ncbi:DUF6685 family protein [Pseudomonas sp. NPDC077405]
MLMAAVFLVMATASGFRSSERKPLPLRVFEDRAQAEEWPYYWKTLPRPHNKHGYAVFLPLTEKRSALVARILEEYGFQDLGAYLSELAARSSSFIQAQHKRELNADS